MSPIGDKLFKIVDQLQKVEAILHESHKPRYLREHQSDREWWILGKTCELLQQGGEDIPVYARRFHPEGSGPDFATYDANSNNFVPIEITEVIQSGRRRADEYKNELLPRSGNIQQIVENPWKPLSQTIRNKARKTYPGGTWLLVYFNISHGRITQFGWWHSTLLANINDQDITYHGRLGRILVINAPANSLVEIVPEKRVIVPEP